MFRRIVLFSKRLRAGAVKTRLVPPLDPAQALSLYRAFLADQIAFVRSLGPRDLRRELSADGPWRPDGELRSLLDGFRLTTQGEGDLGRRMLRAFRRAAADGDGATVILAVDAPTLPARLVEAAFEALARGAAAAVAPAADGGYVLIGMRGAHAELLREVPWGGDRVLETTRARAAAARLALAELPGWYDVDDARGLETLRRELDDPAAARRAPATARCVGALFPAG